MESVLHNEEDSIFLLQGAHRGAMVDYRHGLRRNHTGVVFCSWVGEVGRSIVGVHILSKVQPFVSQNKSQALAFER